MRALTVGKCTRLGVVQSERSTPELGHARLDGRKEERAASAQHYRRIALMHRNER